MSAAAKTGADIIGAQLAKAGATHAFGIPGGEVLALMEGIDAVGIKFVLVKHENSGGFFAEGMWHTTGALPVLIATLGPGVANAVNVVANAMQDRVPLVFLTGCVDAEVAKSYTHQVFDHQALLLPVVKGSFRLESGSIGSTMAKALALAQEGQPGPVHIDVPIGVAEGQSVEEEIALLRAPRPIPSTERIEAVKKLLLAAQRPLAIAGVDAVNEGAGDAISAFCGTHYIPLITTYKGKGLLDETDPLSLGGAGLSPLADKTLLPLIAKADVILLLGYDPIEMRIGWQNPWGEQQTAIEIAPALRDHGMHRIDYALIGNTAEILSLLKHSAEQRWFENDYQNARKALIQAFNSGPEHWDPHAVFRTLREELPGETIATADSGAHRILFRPVLDPGKYCNLQACAQWPAHCPWREVQKWADRKHQSSVLLGTLALKWAQVNLRRCVTNSCPSLSVCSWIDA
jgi:acetolactate synthase I/II/III large subunit